MRPAIIRVPYTPPSPNLPEGSPLSGSEYYVFGHSLFTNGGTVGEYDNVGNWLNVLAGNSSNTASGAFTFGQIDVHLAHPWPNVSTITGTYEGNTRNPVPNELFPGNLFEHFYVMPSNFLSTEMGQSPFSNSPAATATNLQSIIDDILVSYPSGDIILYCHWQDAGPYAGQENMTRATFTTYNNDCMGDYLDWFVDLQDLIVASGRNIRMFPVGPIIAWLLENESYLQSLDFNQLYADSAPHGLDTIYFLAALVVYRAIYRQNPVVSGLTYPVGSVIRGEVTSNLSTIVTQIESRLTYYNNLANRVIVYD